MIILAQDGTAIKPAVAKALAPSVPVIAYDRLIEDPGAFYITFDNVLVGKLQAAAPAEGQEHGQLRRHQGQQGRRQRGLPARGHGPGRAPGCRREQPRTLKNVGETYTDNWDPANAQNEMAQFLTKNNNKIDIAFVENDGMAGGVIAALKSQGLAGTVPVSGQDGDAAALNRVALGTQTVDVWKDARLLGDAAGAAAVQLCAGTALTAIKTTEGGSAQFTTPGSNKINSILITPQAITKDNLQDVLDASWIDKATLCKDVAGKAPSAAELAQ